VYERLAAGAAVEPGVEQQAEADEEGQQAHGGHVVQVLQRGVEGDEEEGRRQADASEEEHQAAQAGRPGQVVGGAGRRRIGGELRQRDPLLEGGHPLPVDHLPQRQPLALLEVPGPDQQAGRGGEGEQDDECPDVFVAHGRVSPVQ
jgi:hypothetical protein